MRIKTLSRAESREAMAEWLSNKQIVNLDHEYLLFRNAFMERYYKLKQQSNKYILDYKLGLFVYSYLRNQSWFNERLAEDDGFWRYLSIKVVPDIVADRWGEENEDHFWKKPVRIWLRVIWWYVHLSWQVGPEAEKRTEEVLSSCNFDTDTILNLVERVGRDGTYIEVYRNIMYYYANLEAHKIKKFVDRQETKNTRKTLFRALMILHNSTCMVIEPGLYLGGEKEYVQKLLNDLLNQVGETL